MSAGISHPKRKRRVVEFSCTEFSVDIGKMKTVAGVTVLSDSLGWNPRELGYSC